MLANAMHDWMGEYVSRTNHTVELERFSAPNLLRYRPGSFFCEHTDAMQGRDRTVSAVALLPSSFTGGAFRFFGDEPFLLEPGDVVLFPSNFLFPHSVDEVLSGVRYSVVSWMT
jgi:predicted 2-oxoglutarate/Fe(II)-dependent dioxygenase YbiX